MTRSERRRQRAIAARQAADIIDGRMALGRAVSNLARDPRTRRMPIAEFIAAVDRANARTVRR